MAALSPALASNPSAIDSAPPKIPESDPHGTWYLGIDIGTTGISATLLNYQTCHLYPIGWIETDEKLPQATLQRLPAIALLSVDQLSKTPEPPIAVGYQALELQLAQSESASTGLLLSHFKHYLNLGIPYIPAYSPVWEPELQWSDRQKIALVWVQQALEGLLAALSAQPNQLLTCIAREMAPDALRAALNQLTGVIVSYPAGWSHAYCFNVREALLSTGLVPHPEQIFFVENTIAALLGELPIPDRARNGLDLTYPVQPAVNTTSWLGSTLVLSAGATTSELLLVNLPQHTDELAYQDLSFRSLEYAGNALAQDIICQLLYPAASGWEGLDLASLDLPRPGEPDPSARYRLQQRLQGSALGQTLLTVAKQLELTLHRQDSAEFRFNQQHQAVTKQEVNQRIVLPYIQYLNRELNTLLTQTGTMVQAVNQIICTGGTASLPAIALWLKQKFPNAVFIQQGDVSLSSSQIASGLAKLPLHPHVLNADRHQYSEYFLLRELLRVLPDQPLSLGRILQLLENQGINTQSCQRTILNLLEGQLPTGLVPDKRDANLLTPESRRNPDYQVLAAPLFSRQSNQIYQVNANLREQLQQYLSAILANSYQTLEEPLIVNLGTEVTV